MHRIDQLINNQLGLMDLTFKMFRNYCFIYDTERQIFLIPLPTPSIYPQVTSWDKKIRVKKPTFVIFLKPVVLLL